jgi:ATP phosphoribosyltransferase
MQIKLALPKGRLLHLTNILLQKSGLELSGYNEHSRSYRPQCSSFPDLFLKIFHERDIPIQVAVGNYDLGICGLDWVEELLAKYPSSALVKVRDLGYGESDLCVAISESAKVASIEELKSKVETIRIATEYPNLAESFALRLRLKRFNIFPLWGAAEVYPPESAELALLPQTPDSPFDQELIPLASILCSSAFLIAHRRSWESKDMNSLLHCLDVVGKGNMKEVRSKGLESREGGIKESSSSSQNSALWLALPDGHQQSPTLEFLSKAGIRVEDQFAESRRPTISLEGVKVKVVRPQDMPLQVANGNFDLAITGEDWLYDHFYRFPSSPVKEILDLGFGKVRVVAVVSDKLLVDSPQDLRELLGRGSLTTLRVASEYTNIADKYARDNHLSPYRLIPTWGASEAFLPEDADLLIENVQTGRTLAQHNLKIIDTLFESSACLIGNTFPSSDLSKQRRMDYVLQVLRQAVGGN